MNNLSKVSKYNLLIHDNYSSTIIVDENYSGQRIDNFLFSILKGVPKSHVYKILSSGEVRINKCRVNIKYKLKINDIMRIPPIRIKKSFNILNNADNRCVYKLPKFNIIFEDQYLIIIDKPYGMAVHGGSGISYGVIEYMRFMRPYEKFLELVHRLDKDTSGILMLAKKRLSLIRLHEQLRDNKVYKSYYACVYGKWDNRWNSEIILKEPLYKYLTKTGERRVCVKDNGISAYTKISLLKKWKNYSLIKAEIKTGRTHQIRVHLSYIGLPIIGDKKYGNFSLNKILSSNTINLRLNRMFLHACKINISHPITGEIIEFNSEIPNECKVFLKQLDFI